MKGQSGVSFVCAALLGALAVAVPAGAMAQSAGPDVKVQPELQFLSPVPAQDPPLQSGVAVDGQNMTPAATAGGQITSGVTVNGDAVATPSLAPAAAAPAQMAQGVDDSQSVILVQKLQQENQRLTGENEELKHQVQQLQAMLSQLQPGAAVSSAAQPAAPAPVVQPDQTAPAPAVAAQPPAAGGADGPLDLSAIAAGLNPGTAPAAPGQPATTPATAPAVATPDQTQASVPDGGSLGSGTNGSPVAPNTTAGLDPQIAFNTAYNYVVKRDFAKAQGALMQFLSTYPSSPQAGSAGYWLGEVLYRQGDYKSAGDRFLKTYKAYPKGEKAPETLLMLGQSLNALGQPEAACSVYAKLGTDFPKLPGTVAARLKDGKKGAACG